MGNTNPFNSDNLLSGMMNLLPRFYGAGDTGAQYDMDLHMITMTYVITLDAEVQKLIKKKKSAIGSLAVGNFFSKMAIGSSDEDVPLAPKSSST